MCRGPGRGAVRRSAKLVGQRRVVGVVVMSPACQPMTIVRPACRRSAAFDEFDETGVTGSFAAAGPERFVA
nr:hypothetical protein GCM10020241_01830 [Streptoalloteichus tenebrarius]